MRRLVCTTPGSLHLEAGTAPEPSPGEVVIRIRRVGVCGTDLHAYHGRQPFVTYPRVLGHELAGEVVEARDVEGAPPVGTRVTILPYVSCGRCVACRRGRPNCCTNIEVLGVHRDGGMADYVSVPASAVVPAPDLGWDELALVECHAIGAHGARRAELVVGDTAVVIGCGPIGLAAAQFARHAGARVITVDRNEHRRAFCRDALGFTDVLGADDGWLEQLDDWTNGERATAVFDATGNAESMRGALDAVAHGGRLIWLGLVRDEIPILHPEFHKRETTLLASRNATREDFVFVLDAFRDGTVRPGCMVSNRSTLESAPDAFAAWTAPGARAVKAMLDV